jgi:hypothetical protein
MTVDFDASLIHRDDPHRAPTRQGARALLNAGRSQVLETAEERAINRSPQATHPWEEITMKARTLISLFTLALAASSGACTAEPQQQQAAAEPTSTSEEAIISTTGNIVAWPAGPLVWDGLNATWPIAVWSPATIGALAFDITGVTNLAITCPACGITAIPITTPILNAFIPPVGVAPVFGTTALFGPAGLAAPALGFDGTFAPFPTLGWGFGAFTGNAALQATFLNGTLTSGWTSAWLNPALTTSALMFTGLPLLNAVTPFMFNVTFMAQSAAQAAAFTSATALQSAALSVFATPIMASTIAAQTAAATIPFMSMVFPIMLPLPAPVLPAAPLIGAPLATGALL